MKLIFFILLLSLFASAKAEETLANDPLSDQSDATFTQPSRDTNEATSTSYEQKSDGKSRFRTKHPGAKEVLYLIDEEGVYHYRVQTISKKDNSMFFRIISQDAPNIIGHTDAEDFTFKDMYNVSSLSGIDFVYEWQPLKSFGKLGVQAGVGFATASGKGYFKSSDASLTGKIPRESYTFFSIPLSLGVVYRFEFMERQWAAPYIAGGGIYNGLVEYRNDSDLNTVGTPAAYGAGGLLINLTALNKDLAFTMDREYGFSQLWLVAEYRRVQSFNKELDITTNQISVGIGADY
jgi:outer membrane lipoprotein-sorting protein